MFEIKAIAKTFILLSLFFVSVLSQGNDAYAKNDEVKLMLEPNKVLFNTSKLAPGRSIEEILTIQNRGDLDFFYNSKINFTGGSQKLFDKLELTVWDASNILFKGNLKGFKGLDGRPLHSFYEEDLKFLITFPTHLGNDYQGLTSNFEIIFSAREQIIDNPTVPDSGDTEQEGVLKPSHPINDKDMITPPLSGQILPSTATNMYNNLFFGAILIMCGVGLVIVIKRSNRNEYRP